MGITIAPDLQPTIAQAQTIMAYKPLEDEKDPYSLVLYFSEKYKVDLMTAFKIAECESGWDIYAQNKTSSAFSVFQVIDGTFAHINKISGLGFKRGNIRDEVEAAIYLMSKEGTRHWNESKSCWNV